MKKFVLRVALIGMLMALMLLASAGAEIIDSGDSGKFWYPYTWTLDDAGTLTITGSTVVSKCAQWENYKDRIRTVVIEEGMTRIEAHCFEQYPALETVVIPGSVTVIERDAFFRCGALTNVFMGKGVARIEMNVFYECENLASVTLPESLEYIGSGVFEHCRKLENVVLPSGLRWIGNGAFGVCESLTRIDIPDSVEYIGGSAFVLCFSLREVRLPKNLPYISYNCFAGCKMTRLDIPDSVTAIQGQAFNGCKELKELKLPQGLKSIGEWAFGACMALGTLDIPDSVEEIDRLAFAGDFTLIVGEGSPAHQMAEKQGWTYRIRGAQGKEEQTGATTVDGMVAQIVANEITDGMTEYQKAMALHNWLVMHAEYDYSFASVSYTAAGPLLHGTAVCNGYTMAYELLLKAVGIQTDRGHGKDHIWNIARLDGVWCHIDVTWDDGGGFGFFGITDEALVGVENHENKTSHEPCNDYRISQAYRSGTMKQLADDWTEQMAEHIRAGETSFTIRHSEISGKRTVERMTAQMVKDTGITLDGRYYPLDAEIQAIENEYVNYNLVVTLRTGDPDYAADTIHLDGHVLVFEPGQEATCTEKGTEACWRCTDCGALFHGNGSLYAIDRVGTTPRKDHQTKEVNRRDATCTEEGVAETHYVCTVCGKQFGEMEAHNEITVPMTVPKKGHSGEWTLTASVEDGDFVEESFERTCTVCGVKETKTFRRCLTPLPGDVNGDGVFDGRDAIRLMKYLAEDEEDTDIVEGNADVNEDGVVDGRDLVRIVKMLAEEEKTAA